jgi:hypothetical protein
MPLGLETVRFVRVKAFCLLLNVDQSADDKAPRLVAEAVGRLNVNVVPLPVMVKSPGLLVTKKWAGTGRLM